MKRNLAAILILLGILAYGVYDHLQEPAPLSSPPSEAGAGPEVGINKGQLAPDFAQEDLQGRTVRLSDYRGKKVLLNFWATWCPPCRVEMPHMQKIYEDYADEVVVLGVNLTTTEAFPDGVSSFVEKRNLTFPILLDPEGEVMFHYRVVAYPTTYVLDTRGVIRERFQGAIDYQTMAAVIKRIS